MWQAQLKGSKTWFLEPSPECENVCQSFEFLVEAGDAGNIIIRRNLVLQNKLLFNFSIS